MGNYIGTNGYYEGDRQHPDDSEVERRPSPWATWTGAEWVDGNPPISSSVTMRQARLALLQSGLLDSVNAAIQQSGGAASIEWEYATAVDRQSPLVASLAGALNLTEAHLDNLFTLASTL